MEVFRLITQRSGVRITPHPHKRYQELDALRGIAALFVVFFHFTMGREGLNTFFKLGTTGVDLFFIISGFVIFMSLQKISKGRDFVINRVVFIVLVVIVIRIIIPATNFTLKISSFIFLRVSKNVRPY